ncbi:hypothetical protein DI392_17490 [Vibrio albus]|uniref:Uncharacterized protein n=1 Tax=Vibrio albus TaxID=2200953 RepID=A0A2U3B5S6_9VIBR|nr:hypothetical protein [Vibrio albus]PWI32153.1 hypothetical protein DI392_17490 [Vibrio albus]
MIYTFIIAGGCKKLSDLKRIRTVSVVAQTERLARQQLAVLPLMFMSRTTANQYPALSGHLTTSKINDQEVAA